MPTYEVELSDGRTFHVDADAQPSEQDVMAALGTQASGPEPQGSGGASATIAAGRAVPAVAQGVARFAANHPAATQKVIGAGISTAAGAGGAAVGGIPGAVVGASIRGVTPAQTTIRQTAGRWAGETPAVAENAARALGIQNYAKETTGLRLAPSDIINKPNAANAIEHYANSMEKGILRLYGPSGEVVSGPSAVSRIPMKPQPGIAARGMSAIGKVLSPLQGMTAMTDLAQTAEPLRRDIGVMGIGAAQPQPTMAEALKANATNQQRAEAQYRALILAQMGP